VRAECTAPGFLDTAQARSGRNHPFESYRHVEIFHGVQGDIFGKNPPGDTTHTSFFAVHIRVPLGCSALSPSPCLPVSLSPALRVSGSPVR